MAKRVSEIMNRELFSIRADERSEDIAGYILQLGITGGPVLDDEHKPIGFASLRDLVGPDCPKRVHLAMTSPADTIEQGQSVEAAADKLCELGRHHLVVVDELGRAVGFVGTLDVLAALRGFPVQHPASFPHYDSATGLSWTDNNKLSMDGVQAAPDGPGLCMLVRPEPGQSDRVVWSEASHNVRTRLLDMLARPTGAPPHLVGDLEAGRLWFRAAGAPATRVREEMGGRTP